MRDVSPEVSALYAIYDRLGFAIHVIAAAGGLKGQLPPQEPHPRPVTALDAARDRRRARVHEWIVSKVLPGRR